MIMNMPLPWEKIDAERTTVNGCKIGIVIIQGMVTGKIN